MSKNKIVLTMTVLIIVSFIFACSSIVADDSDSFICDYMGEPLQVLYDMNMGL
jgi:hypothetical protein